MSELMDINMLDAIYYKFRAHINKAERNKEEYEDILDDLWSLTGTLWEQNETTTELKLMLSEFKERMKQRKHKGE